MNPNFQGKNHYSDSICERLPNTVFILVLDDHVGQSLVGFVGLEVDSESNPVLDSKIVVRMCRGTGYTSRDCSGSSLK